MENKNDGKDGGSRNGEIWKLKKELFPRNKDPITAMIDPESGNLLTNVDKIEKAAINVYRERLKTNQLINNLNI